MNIDEYKQMDNIPSNTETIEFRAQIISSQIEADSDTLKSDFNVREIEKEHLDSDAYILTAYGELEVHYDEDLSAASDFSIQELSDSMRDSGLDVEEVLIW